MSIESNIDKSLRVVDTAINLLDTATTQEDLRKIAEDAVDEIKSNIQSEGHIFSGDLHADVGIKDEKTGAISIGSSLDYAVPFEYGHGEIVPVKAKVLHFTTKDGKEVFTKRVGAINGTGIFEKSILTRVPKSVEEIAKKKNEDLSKQ